MFAQLGGRDAISVRKINYLGTILGKLLFITIIQVCSFPFVAMEHNVKMSLFEERQLVHCFLWHHFVNIPDSLNDSLALLIGNKGALMFIGPHTLIGANTDNEIITLLFSAT